MVGMEQQERVKHQAGSSGKRETPKGKVKARREEKMEAERSLRRERRRAVGSHRWRKQRWKKRSVQASRPRRSPQAQESRQES